MPTTKNPLASNPLDADTQLRSMVRGEPLATDDQKTITAPPPEKPTHRVAVYLLPSEYEKLRIRAFQDRRPMTDIMRQAVRREIGLQ